MSAFSLTRFTASQPARLSKSFHLTDGRLVKESGGQMFDGIAEQITVDPAGFADLLVSLKPSQALSYGVNGHDKARVVPVAKLPSKPTRPPTIARDRHHFAWPANAGVMMLDYDPPPEGPTLEPEHLRQCLYGVWPGLQDAPHLWRPSAGGCIHTADGTELKGVSGQRLYVVVAQAADIPRAGAVLFDRLWLAGLGRYEVSKSGALLLRSIIDSSVFQPERLDFCGGAECGPGLVQHLPPPLVFNADDEPIDTTATLRDLTPQEAAEVKALREKAATELAGVVKSRKESWIEGRVADALMSIPVERRHEERPRLIDAYRRACEDARLLADYPLELEEHGTVTVGGVLDNPNKYHGCRTLDPLEPDYNGGRHTGWLNLRTAGRPYLWSHAHGGKRFTLHRTSGQATIDKAIAGTRETYSGQRREPSQHIDRSARQAPSVPQSDSGLFDDAKIARLFHTDLGNSERLVARHGGDIRYCFDFGKWLIWDGVRWAIDRDGAALEKAKDTARKMLVEASTLTDREDSRKLAAWSFRSQARDRLAAMLYLAQPNVSVRPEHLDTHPWLLNVENGTIDLQTGTLRQASRADLLTKAAPVTYDPKAICQEWLTFLEKIFGGDAEIIRYLQKAVGYSLTGDDREQAFFVGYGTGRNGKSTLLETIAAVLGEDYSQQAAPELLMQKTHDRHPTELAALRGMRLVTAIETGQGRHLNEPLIKQLTGGDRISARFMHGDFFTFTPTHKLWMATNHKPVIRGTDLGIWRRIKLIPFTVQISDDEKDDGLKARLRTPQARAGILNWMLEGARLWQIEGLKPPAAVTDATQAYREEMDVLAAWISECCVVKKVAEAPAADLYKSYSDWCDANGERPESQRSFGLRLAERGFDQKKRNNGTRHWLGIGLLESGASGASGVDSRFKKPNSGEGFSNLGNPATYATYATTSPDSGISSQHLAPSSPVEASKPAPEGVPARDLKEF